MVFRRETKVDAFQRQISALRQQIGAEEGQEEYPNAPQREGASGAYGFSEFASNAAAQPSGASDAPVEPELPATPAVTDMTTVIAQNATWKGELQSDGAVHVHGRFEGSIRATDDIFVAEEAEVDATLSAANVVIAGTIRGSIRCGARFEMLPTGRVTGDIQSPALVVHEGANVTAQFRMGAPDLSENVPTPVVARRPARGVS